MLAGIYPIVPTPFDDKGAIDGDSIGTLTEFMVGCRVDGLAILGVMGEADKLTEAERDDVVQAFRKVLPRDRALVVDAGAPGTDAAIHACARAIELGADALLVGPPRIQNDTVLFEYYARIARVVAAPIIVHDYPPATGVLMSPPRCWHASTESSSGCSTSNWRMRPPVRRWRGCGNWRATVSASSGRSVASTRSRNWSVARSAS